MPSDPALERRVLDLFQEVLDLPTDQRVPWIESHSDLNSPLRTRLMALLAGDSLANLRTGGAAESAADVPIPDQIGAYCITNQIGQGGMGAVYRGERNTGDFDHVAAIKVIRPSALSDALVGRFARERQTLAQLNHPHIARLYDGGEMPDGAPYLVMEYVQGATLSGWIETKNADLQARVSLFRQICDAVEYAHQNLVIHRDLTPSNILVTDKDEAKLIDFGIARPQVEADDSATGSTFSGLSLTPGFAAPERLAGAEANTLVDVYSLGKILHVLMGNAPEPEIEAIASKAQAYQPADRYPTVSALKEAIEDWRERRPVEAFSNASWYRFRKFIDRERVIVGAAASISVVLIGGLLATGLAYSQAERERSHAEQRFAENRSLSKHLIENVVKDLEAVPGTAAIRLGIAERGRLALESLSKVPGAPPDLLADTAVAYRQIGESMASPDFKGSVSAETAITTLAKAEQLHRTLVRTFPDRSVYKLELAKAITAHAFRLIVLKNDAMAASKLLDEADALLHSLPSAVNDVKLVKLKAANARANMYDVTSDYARAYPHIDTSLALAQSIQPKTKDERLAVATAINSLMVNRGDALWYDRDDKQGALVAYRASLQPLDRPEFADDIRVIKMQVFGASNLASTLFELGQKQEALRVSRAGIELAKRMRLFDDSIRALQLESTIHGEYSLELYALGQVKEGDAEAKITLDIRRELRRRMPGSYESLRPIPVAQRPLGEALEELGQKARACTYYKQALGEWANIEKSGYEISNFDEINEVDWLKKRMVRC